MKFLLLFQCLETELFTATEILVDTMERLGIKKLVHVGDAYSALPIEDNYGLGEHVFMCVFSISTAICNS